MTTNDFDAVTISCMRLFKIAILIFVFNVAVMPLVSMIHESSHQNNQELVSFHRTEFGQWDSVAILQFAGDDSHHLTQSSCAVATAQACLDSASDNETGHCHHFSLFAILSDDKVLGVQASETCSQSAPIFSLGIVPKAFEHPPKNSQS